jgi:hypothetical protein
MHVGTATPAQSLAFPSPFCLKISATHNHVRQAAAQAEAA